jgi:hypothetical protein
MPTRSMRIDGSPSRHCREPEVPGAPSHSRMSADRLELRFFRHSLVVLAGSLDPIRGTPPSSGSSATISYTPAGASTPRVFSSVTLRKTPRRIASCVMRPKKTLDLIEPGGRGRCEVKMDALVTSQPSLDRGVLVGGVVVDDQSRSVTGNVSKGRFACHSIIVTRKRRMRSCASPIGSSPA